MGGLEETLHHSDMGQPIEGSEGFMHRGKSGSGVIGIKHGLGGNPSYHESGLETRGGIELTDSYEETINIEAMKIEKKEAEVQSQKLNMTSQLSKQEPDNRTVNLDEFFVEEDPSKQCKLSKPFTSLVSG